MINRYNIERLTPSKCNEGVESLADRYLIKAYNAYREVWFISKKKRLRLVKRLAWDNLELVKDNLCHHSWVCLSKSEIKKKPVRDVFHEAMESLDLVTSIKRK